MNVTPPTMQKINSTTGSPLFLRRTYGTLGPAGPAGARTPYPQCAQ
jgi:hypothetical protein